VRYLTNAACALVRLDGDVAERYTVADGWQPFTATLTFPDWFGCDEDEAETIIASLHRTVDDIEEYHRQKKTGREVRRWYSR